MSIFKFTKKKTNRISHTKILEFFGLILCICFLSLSNLQEILFLLLTKQMNEHQSSRSFEEMGRKYKRSVVLKIILMFSEIIFLIDFYSLLSLITCINNIQQVSFLLFVCPIIVVHKHTIIANDICIHKKVKVSCAHQLGLAKLLRIIFSH